MTVVALERLASGIHIQGTGLLDEVYLIEGSRGGEVVNQAEVQGRLSVLRNSIILYLTIIHKVGVTAGNDGRSLLVACRTDNLGIQLFVHILFLLDDDAVFGHIVFALSQRCRRQILEYLQLIVALADKCSEGDGDGQAYHTRSRYAHTHGIFQDIGTQQGLYSLRTAAQLFGCPCRTQGHTHGFGTPDGRNHLLMHQRYNAFSQLFVHHTYLYL